jgi:hypothetical protein
MWSDGVRHYRLKSVRTSVAKQGMRENQIGRGRSDPYVLRAAARKSPTHAVMHRTVASPSGVSGASQKV